MRFLEIFQKFSDYDSHDISFLVSRKAARILNSQDQRVLAALSIPNWWQLPLAPIAFLDQLWTLLRITKTQKRQFLFVMPSPSDIFLLIALKVCRFSCSFLLHDSMSHSGEKWPTKRAIKFRIGMAKQIFTLSNYTHDEILDSYGAESIVLNPPPFTMSPSAAIDTELMNLENYFLFVGRIRDYKGILDLIEAFERRKRDSNLVIAGEGNFRKRNRENIIVINRWLSDSEIEYLINAARVVVFPYRDASQSGIIPLCISLGAPMIVSDAGALAEQARYGRLIGVFRVGDIESLADLLTKAEAYMQQPEAFSRSDFSNVEDVTQISCTKFVKELVACLED